MGVLFFIFTCISVLAAISLHISFTIRSKKPFDRVIRVLLVLIVIQVIYAFLIHLAPYEYRYVDRAEPLGLLYGPLLYFAYITSSGRRLSRKTILFHTLPFVFAVPVYVLFLADGSFRAHDSLYYSFLYGLMALSWFGYASWVAYQSTKLGQPVIPKNKELSLILVIILLGLSFYFILLVVTRTIKGIPAESITGNIMVYGATLGGILAIYLFMIRRLKEEIYLLAIGSEKPDDTNVEVSQSYLKSGVQTDDIEEYARKVSDFLVSKKYLDPRFNLKMMSSALKIPKHHLSQVFNQYYGQSFLKYINSLRIMHACELLEDPDSIFNIEDLAEQCGFNSKTSFYRNFREIANMTPTEFLNRSEQADSTSTT